MPGGTRPRAGRKPVRINLGELEKLCALQCTDEEVASFFRVSVRTVERRRRKPAFAEAMERGKAQGRLSLRRSLWGLARKGNPAANIFLAKNLLGYRDVLSNEHSGPGGSAIPIDARPDLSRLSDEEFERLQALVEKAQPGSGKP
jgi:hypothetical protein